MKKLLLAAVLAVLCLPLWAATDCVFIRGDANHDSSVTLADVSYIGNYLYSSGPAPFNFDAADADNSGALNPTDMVYICNWYSLGGPQPDFPFPDEDLEGEADDNLEFAYCGTSYPFGTCSYLTIGDCDWAISYTAGSGNLSKSGCSAGVEKNLTSCSSSDNLEATLIFIQEIDGMDPIPYGELKGLSGNTNWKLSTRLDFIWELILAQTCNACDQTPLYSGKILSKNDNLWSVFGDFQVTLFAEIDGEPVDGLLASSHGNGDLFVATGSDPYYKLWVSIWANDWVCDCNESPWEYFIVDPSVYVGEGWNESTSPDNYLDLDNYRTRYSVGNGTYACISNASLLYQVPEEPNAYETQVIYWTGDDLSSLGSGSEDLDAEVVFTAIQVSGMKIKIDIVGDPAGEDDPMFKTNEIWTTIDTQYIQISADDKGS